MKTSINQIKAYYSFEKKRWDFSYPWIYFVIRPLSFWLTWLLLPLRISANQTTLLSLLIGLTSCAFFTKGYGEGFYLGTALLILFNIMDCVDGNIARLKKTVGPVGRYYDGLVGNVHTLVYLFIGFGLYRTPDRSLFYLVPEVVSKETTAIVFFCAGVSITVAKMLSMQVRNSFFSALEKQWTEYKSKRENADFTHTGRWYYYLYNNITDLQGHEFVLLGAVIAHLVGLFVLLSALISMLNLIFLIILHVWRINKMYV